MEPTRKYRLEKELARNDKRIKECQTEANILRNRNTEIRKELGIEPPKRNKPPRRRG